VTAVVVSAVVLASAVALILLGRRLSARVASAPNPAVALNVRYQPIALGVAVLAVLAVRALAPGHADFLAVGDWSAPAQGLGWLGVADGDSWVSVGGTFLAITTVVTAVVVWLQVGRPAGVGWRALVAALPLAVVFSASNALAEELLFRLTVTEALAPVATAGMIAALSAVLFGFPHWFGNPGRLPGVLMAGFVGALLALSVLQTGGLGWALAIHFALDVVILTIVVAAGSTRTSSPVSVDEEVPA
jgi:uncharacterized protein